jgi:hypothetical protein
VDEPSLSHDDPNLVPRAVALMGERRGFYVSIDGGDSAVVPRFIADGTLVEATKIAAYPDLRSLAALAVRTWGRKYDVSVFQTGPTRTVLAFRPHAGRQPRVGPDTTVKTLRHLEPDLANLGTEWMERGLAFHVSVDGDDAAIARAALISDGEFNPVAMITGDAGKRLGPLQIVGMRSPLFKYEISVRRTEPGIVEFSFHPRLHAPVRPDVPWATAGGSLDLFVCAAEENAVRSGSLEFAGHLDIVVEPDDFQDYGICRNVRVFASLGVDGVHYALVGIGGAIVDESPVIEVSPTDSESVRFIAPDLVHFLAWGCDVQADEISRLFEAELRGSSVLMAFLNEHFVYMRLSEPRRIEELARKYASLLPTILVSRTR